MISTSFEDLAQALRLLHEANIRAHHEGLIFVDRAEAIGNIEAGLNSVVNAFHSLYDACEKGLLLQALDWYKHPELATILAIRNARHHNKANKIRQLYNFHVQTTPTPQNKQKYVVVDFPTQEEGGDTFDVYLSWSDLDEFLGLPSKESRMRSPTIEGIHAYLASQSFPKYAAQNQLPVDRVFFNVVPLIVNAAIKLVPQIRSSIVLKSTEAKVFVSLFEDMPPALISQHSVNVITIFLPN